MTRIGHSSYLPIHDKDGRPLEAVYRMQEAGSAKSCSLDICPLGGNIGPMEKYARVYYQDTDEVEVFHYACFRKEFTDDHRF